MATREITIDEATFIHNHIVKQPVPPNIMLVSRLNYHQKPVLDIYVNLKYQEHSISVRFRQMKKAEANKQQYFIAVYIDGVWCDPWQQQNTLELIHEVKIDMLKRYLPVAIQNSKK